MDKFHYYELHVEMGVNEYSFGIKSDTPITDQKEAIKIALENDLFQEESDQYCVDSFHEIEKVVYDISYGV